MQSDWSSSRWSDTGHEFVAEGGQRFYEVLGQLPPAVQLLVLCLVFANLAQLAIGIVRQRKYSKGAEKQWAAISAQGSQMNSAIQSNVVSLEFHRDRVERLEETTAGLKSEVSQFRQRLDVAIALLQGRREAGA